MTETEQQADPFAGIPVPGNVVREIYLIQQLTATGSVVRAIDEVSHPAAIGEALDFWTDGDPEVRSRLRVVKKTTAITYEEVPQ